MNRPNNKYLGELQMLKLRNKKRIMIPMLVLILLVAMAGTVWAMPESGTEWDQDGYAKIWWHQGAGLLGTNSMSNYDSNETRLIQTLMGDLEYSVDIDGRYGNDTYAVVHEWQTGNWNINTADGIVGPNTWYWLEYELGNQNNHYSSSSNRWYWEYRTPGLSTEYKYRHYEDGKWYVLVNGSWYHFN